MKNQSLVKTLWICGLLLPVFVQAQAESRWYFEVGPAYRGDMELSVRGGTHVPAWGGTRSSGVQMPPAATSLLDDDGTAQQLRTFDDGFVGPSGWAHAREDGRTQYWGYEDAGQYDEYTGILSFHQTLTGGQSGSRTVTRLLDKSVGWAGRKSMEGAGLMLTAGRQLRAREQWSCSIQARLGWLEGLRANFRRQTGVSRTINSLTYRQNRQQSQTYRYDYDTLGNPAFPSAPYAMSDPNAAGPMIADTPDAIVLDTEQKVTSEYRVGRRVWSEQSTVNLAFDARLFTFQLGPRFEWRTHEAVTFLAQPSISLNLLDAEIRRDETLRSDRGDVLEHWSDRTNTLRWRAGAGGQLGARLNLWNDWGVTLVGGYDWVDTASFDAGPDRVGADISCYQGEILFGRAF